MHTGKFLLFLSQLQCLIGLKILSCTSTVYTKGDDVYLWRCNQTKKSMPMKTEDFDDLGKVTNHLDLVGLGNTSIINWDKDNYNNLVRYISSMRLLVNSHGLVIAELNKYTSDGKIDDSQSRVYIRALDVLSLEPFNLRERPIPPRTAGYLEGDGTRDVPIVEVTNLKQEYLGKVEKSVTDWMNDFSSNNWVGIEKVYDLTSKQFVVTVVEPQGTYTVDDNRSNVRAGYFYRVKVSGLIGDYKALAIEDLNLGKEKARFSMLGWWLIKCNGITYVIFYDSNQVISKMISMK